MTLLQDLRYAARTAWRDRTFSLIAVITLALGIGANTALFTIVNAIVLAPLPFRSPEQLVRVTADFTRQPVRDVGCRSRSCSTSAARTSSTISVRCGRSVQT
jgi:putative ABC transport system permease protein